MQRPTDFQKWAAYDVMTEWQDDRPGGDARPNLPQMHSRCTVGPACPANISASASPELPCVRMLQWHNHVGIGSHLSSSRYTATGVRNVSSNRGYFVVATPTTPVSELTFLAPVEVYHLRLPVPTAPTCHLQLPTAQAAHATQGCSAISARAAS